MEDMKKIFVKWFWYLIFLVFWSKLKKNSLFTRLDGKQNNIIWSNVERGGRLIVLFTWTGGDGGPGPMAV